MNHHSPTGLLYHNLSAFPARAYGKFAGRCGDGKSVHVGEIPSCRRMHTHAILPTKTLGPRCSHEPLGQCCLKKGAVPH